MEAGGFSEGEDESLNQKGDVAEDDQNPYLIKVDDGRTVMVHCAVNKQLLLPGKFEWRIQDPSCGGDAILECVNGSYPKRFVKNAFTSSKTTAVGETIPPDEVKKVLEPKPKKLLVIPVAKAAASKAAAAVPPTTPAAAETPKDEGSETNPEEVEDLGANPGSGIASDERPITDSMDETTWVLKLESIWDR